MSFFKDFLKGIMGTDTNISAQDAHKMMGESKDCVLLDVRTPFEYKEVRIKGAKLIPVDELASRAGAELPDKQANILIYCQSGARSGRAVRILSQMGYTNARSFGGILNWPYETVRGE